MRSEKLLTGVAQKTKKNTQAEYKAQVKTNAAIERENLKALKTKEREALQTQKRIEREKLASAKRAAAAQAREEKALQKKRLDYERATTKKATALRRSIGGAVRGGARVMGGAVALAGGFSAAQGISERISADTGAAGLANRTIAAGSNGGKNFQQLKGEIFNRARSEQEKYGLKSQDSVIGLESSYNERTGEFGAGSSLTPALVQMAQAVGMAEDEFSQLGKAAGDTFVNLKNSGKTTEEATEATKKAMLAAVGQGTKGSISMGDFSKIGAKLLSVSGQIGGDASTNLNRTVALANAIAPNVGSSEETSTSIEGIARDFSSKSKIFKSMGIDTRDEKGNTRDLQDLIIQSAIKTGGSQDKMNKLFGDTSRKGVGGFFKNVRELKASGKSDDEIEKILRGPLNALNEASLTEAKAKELAANMAGTNGAKLTRAMDKLKNTLGEKLEPALLELIPALTELVPYVSKLAGYFADFVSWFAKNPLSGMSALIMGSIAKDLASAKIGSFIQGVLQKSMGGSGGTGTLPGGAIGGGAKAGLNLGTAGAVLFAAEAGRLLGMAAAEALDAAWDKSAEKAVTGNLEGVNALGHQFSLEEKKQALAKLDKNLQEQKADASSFTGVTQSMFGDVARMVTGNSDLEDPDVRHYRETYDTKAKLQDQIRALEEAKIQAQEKDVKALEEFTKMVEGVTTKLKKTQGGRSSVAPPGSTYFDMGG